MMPENRRITKPMYLSKPFSILKTEGTKAFLLRRRWRIALEKVEHLKGAG